MKDSLKLIRPVIHRWINRPSAFTGEQWAEMFERLEPHLAKIRPTAPLTVYRNEHADEPTQYERATAWAVDKWDAGGFMQGPGRKLVSRIVNPEDVVFSLRHFNHHAAKHGVRPVDGPGQPSEVVVKPQTPKVKMARYQAPAGGAITNNTFQQGGQFLPKALGRIRDVMKRYNAKRKGAAPAVKLATVEPAFKQAGFGDLGESLTHEQLRKVEDFFQIPDKKRLSTNKALKVDPKTGQITAKNEHVVKLLDHISKAAVPASDLRRFLRNPNHEDATKHAVHHLTLEANAQRGRETEGSGQDWYAGELKHFDDGLHKLMTKDGGHWDEHHGSLAKILLALTSGGQNPVLNTSATVRMLRAGMKRGGMHMIPETNEDELAKWLQAHPDAGPPPLDMKQRIDWAINNRGETSKEAPGWKALQARYIHRPGHEDHGKVLGYYAGDDWVNLAGEDGGKLIGKHKRAKAIKGVEVPSLDADGKLIAKGWTNRNEQVVANLRKFKDILAKFGNDPKKASEWFLADHSPEDIAKVTGSVPEPGYVQNEDGKLPGTFALGPKFGPFALNLHIPQSQQFGKYLTADMWWARTWNRYFGTLRDGTPKEKKEGVKAPRNDAERRRMWDAAKRATKEAGLSSVAELQAVLWYYEQRLWRLFGAKNKSYSYRHGIEAAKRNKLSRADVRPFQAAFDKEYQKARTMTEYRGSPAHDALADYLDERDDPRADLVKAREDMRPGPEHFDAFARKHTFPDGTEMRIAGSTLAGRYSVAWDHVPNGVAPMYRKDFSAHELHQWLGRFPDAEREKMYGNLKLKKPEVK